MEMTEKMQKKLNDGREYRNMVLEVSQPTEESDWLVEGYATTFDQPYHLYSTENGGEVREEVSKDAFLNADMSDTIFQLNHEGTVYARMSNDTMKLDVDEHGLKVTAYLGGTTNGKNLFEEIKGGYINKMSFGFIVADDEIKADGKDYLRTIKRISKVFDVSAVSIPANDYTVISARSHIDGAIDEIEAERLRLEEEQRIQAEKREHLAERLNALKGERNGN